MTKTFAMPTAKLHMLKTCVFFKAVSLKTKQLKQMYEKAPPKVIDTKFHSNWTSNFGEDL